MHAFLQRVFEHLSLAGQGLPRNLLRQHEDTQKEFDPITTFILPGKELAKEYVACYFEHANITYRYLPQADVYGLLDRLYEDDLALLNNESQMAIILLVLGIGYVLSSQADTFC